MVCLVVVTGVVVTAAGAVSRHRQTVQAASLGPADGGGPASVPAAPRPDGRVEDPDRTVYPVPPGWDRVGPLLAWTVDEAGATGHALAACVLALDAPDPREACAGDDQPRYAASVIKLSFAVAALEAWGGDPGAATPYGPLDDLLDAAISVSDNEAANLLYDLSVVGPTAPATDDPLEAINAVTDRVGLAEQFHAGGAFRYDWTGDWSRVTARGGARYLEELVRAADGRAADGRALTSPAIARIVLEKMAAQERRWKLPGGLPDGSVANKTGETDTESHDLAVVHTATGRYAIAVVSTAAGMYDTPDELMTGLGREVVGALGGAVRF